MSPVPFDARSYPRQALIDDAPNMLGVSSAAALAALGVAKGYITLGEAKALVTGDVVAGPFRVGYVDIVEQPEPAAPSADQARLFVRDNGAGKTQLCAKFSSGVPVVIATQP